MKYKECFLNDNTCGSINKETGKPKIKEAHILSRAATMSKICGNVNGQKEVYKASTQKSEGWKKASAYHCFCENHDTEFFYLLKMTTHLIQIIKNNYSLTL